MKTIRKLTAILGLCAACGGKVDGESPNGALGDGGGEMQTPPTCAAICDRFARLCGFASASASCVSDCESSRVQFASCKDELDSLLRCLGTTRVTCNGMEIVIIDCSDERTAVEKCRRP
jgi:hypothetical protein